MKSYQHRVMLFFVGLIIISSCLTSTAAPWEKKDGRRLIVPERLARLLRKITKHKSEEDFQNYDVETTLKMMSLNGIRSHNKVLSPVKDEEADSELGSARPRQKRSVKTNNLPSSCHSDKVYVNLTKYQNIIAPLGFHTHYCGSTYLVPVGNDPIVQILSQAIIEAFNSLKKFSSKVLANAGCCAPKKIQDLYVLYMDQGKFTSIRSIPNVVASHCVCKNN